MTVREVTLMEVLDNREARVRRQQELLNTYHTTLICFTLNIPGPVKNSDLIHAGFRLGCRMLMDLLNAGRISVVFQESTSLVTGCEGFFAVDADPEQVKQLCVNLEDSIPVGRLFDLDVFTPDGKKLDRHGAPRKCLICDQPARVCGPVRAHSAAQLRAKAEELLEDAVFSDRANAIAAKAVQALLYEVCVSPKPGLVDRLGRGSHEDMDIYTFLASAPALQPYFVRCARIGMDTRADAPETVLPKLRFAGQLAEGDMFRATDGVNTHKGAVFTMGLACAAAGRLVLSGQDTPEEILPLCAAMTQGLTQRELGHITPETARTAGERLYAQHGITGIRGQAEQGFPAVLSHGLPVLRQGLSMGLSMDRAGCAALLALITAADDTNLIHRGSRGLQQSIQSQLRALLEQNPFPEPQILAQLDEAFVEQHLSPGGSADLLALCLFLHLLCD